ncbi:hypothetical protein, partial [Pseudomonas asturiensis]|uniref:hypothetical protein n=1 Tax=Pseudomonas asturiensis TaxID=1190415 RepID=UPI001C313FEC
NLLQKKHRRQAASHGLLVAPRRVMIVPMLCVNADALTGRGALIAIHTSGKRAKRVKAKASD